MTASSVIKSEMQKAGLEATQAYLDKYYGGKDNYPCGFAWIVVRPNFAGTSTLGKQERKILQELGFEKSYAKPKEYHLWNPGKHNCQNVDAKYAGAAAACKVLEKYGINAFPDQRWD